jgi:hypothetical protein
MRKFYTWLDDKVSGNSTSSRWGFFSVLISIDLSLFPLSVSFWAISISLEGGKIMYPSSLLSWLFSALAAISFVFWLGFIIFTILTYRHWRINPLIDNTQQRFDNVQDDIKNLNGNLDTKFNNLIKEIHELTIEIRQDRNARHN